jgi:Phage portal protein/Family of unknown function (DUF5872)
MAESNRIFGRRAARRQAEIEAAISRGIEDGIEKAMSPAVAMAGQMSSGATYPVFQRSQDSPFNQVGPGQGFEPLPRPPGMFDSGFGPANPLFPDAIDSLTPSGRTLARRTEYLIAANVNLIDRRVPWSVLRGLAEDVDVVQRCIQIVQDALVGLDWSWGFSPQIIQQIMTEESLTNSSKAASYARDKYGEELARVQTFFQTPDKRMGFTFSQWLTDMIYSHLVYDGIVVAPEYNLKGELMSLSTIDTSTIKILLDNQGFIPRPPAPAYQQILYGFPRGEFQAENVAQDGSVPDAYTSDQLAYYIRRPRPNNIYGYSQVEECINIASIYMERQAWLASEYTNGVTPKMAVTVDAAETWSPEQLAYYERIYNDQFSGQTNRRQQFMLFRPGMHPQQLKSIDEAYKNTYDEWLVQQIGAKFGVPSNMLGITARSSIGGGHEKGQSDQYEQYATDALKNFLIECINDMARRFLGVGPELTMTATGGGNDQDDLTRAQADQIDVSTGIRTRNEIRAERGIPLMSEPEADRLGVSTGTGVTFLAGTLAAQESQQGAGAANGTTAATQPAGESGDARNADGTDGSGSDSRTPSPKSVGDTPSQSSDREKPAPVDAKDDKRQPEAEKELQAFERFAKARIARHSWRDFDFECIGSGQAAVLNELGRQRDLVGIRHEIAKADGNAQALIDWYNDGADGQIDWGKPGDFDACVAVAGKYIDDPEGFCNLRHQDAVGGPPGSEDATKAEYDEIIEDRDGEPTDKDLYDKVIEAAKRKFDVYPSAYANGWVVQEYKRRGGKYRKTVKKGDVAGHDFHGNQWTQGSGGESGEGHTNRISADDLELRAIEHPRSETRNGKPLKAYSLHDSTGRQVGIVYQEVHYVNSTPSGRRIETTGRIVWMSRGEPKPDPQVQGYYTTWYSRRARSRAEAIDMLVNEYNGGEQMATKAADDSFTPPKAVQAEAQRALEWLKEGEAGSGFTDVGRKRASDLAAGHAISLDTIKRMSSYLARHEVDKKGKGWSPGEEGYPSPGRVAWAAWGGDPAVSWTNGILRSAEKAQPDEIEAADTITKMLEPELQRLRESYGLLARVRARISKG